MSNSTDAPTGKNYAIMRVERIRDLAEMRRIEQHNTREKQSENVEPGGPAPRELLPDAHTDTVSGARERMVELGLDLAKLTGAVGVEVILTTSHAWWAMATDQMKRDWIDANLGWLEGKFGRALLSAKLHEDEKTPHIHAVALSAVSKIDSVRGPKPKTDEGWARRRAEEEKRVARWRWNYRDLFGQDFEHLSREQDRYHAAVAHLNLDRGERRREVTDVVLENGVVIPASQLSRGKRRDGSDRPRRTVTTQQNQAAARDDRARAAEERRQAEQDREAAAVARAKADADRAAVAAAHENADLVAQQADTDRRAAAAALADAEQQRKMHEDAIAEQRHELSDMLAAAVADRAEAGRLRRDVDAAHTAATASQKRSAADALAAEQARHDAEATRTAAVAERDAATAARREFDERRALHVAQLSLLARAADDTNGLDLRSSGKTFVMRDWRMTDTERGAHTQPWSPPLVAIARVLAVALEGLRDLARRLAGREKAISEREAAAEAREAKQAQDRMDHDAQLAGHRAAIADLDRRRQTVDVAETRAKVAISTAEATLASAHQTQADADASLSQHRRWIQAMDALEANPDWVEIDARGRLRLDPAVARASPPELVATLREPAPAWAVALAAQRLDLADVLRRAEDREREAAYATERLTDMIDKAGPVFAEWRVAGGTAINTFLQAVKRGEDGATDAGRAIGARLTALRGIVEAAAPLNAAIEQAQRMETARGNHAAKTTRIAACGRAAAALDLLVPLGDLAQGQVDTLRHTLHDRSEHWRTSIYRNATLFAPDLTGTGMDARGVLELKVGRDGVTAPAQHISNASALRGALLGFFLAFREHVLTSRGGLALLVLDDPQELLDHDNRQRLAHGLSGVAAGGAQLLITTHDRRFARSLVAETRSADRVEHLSVHPVNGVRPTLGLSPAIEEVDRRRLDFLAVQDGAPEAQTYASDVRVFLEARLGDLFDDLVEPAHATATRALTLFPLVDRLRGLVTNGSGELFANPVLKRFVDDPGLAEGAAPRRVLNTSHHDKASLSYMDVKHVDGDLVRLRGSIEKVHEQFRLHRWRDPLAPVGPANDNVVPLSPMVRPTFAVPICPDIAAFVGTAPGGGSQDVATEQLDGDWFDGKALYYVRGESLGFPIPSGAVAIVEAEPYPGRDQNLVIALYREQVLACRMAKSPGALGVSLSAQMPDPRHRRPTMTYDESKVRLHRIVGAIFTAMPPPVGGGEATAVETAPELARIEIAYRVREESAVPLALPGQVILGGAELTATDLDSWEGRLVAVTLDDGTSLFKRVGAHLPGNLAHLRQFESIGGLGSSVVISTESVDGSHGAPVMMSARRVLGVLYE